MNCQSRFNAGYRMLGPPPATAPHPYCLIHRPGQPLSHHSHVQLMTKGYDPNSTTSRAAPFSLPHPSLSSLDHLS